jgi:hypothetical protein
MYCITKDSNVLLTTDSSREAQARLEEFALDFIIDGQGSAYVRGDKLFYADSKSAPQCIGLYCVAKLDRIEIWRSLKKRGYLYSYYTHSFVTAFTVFRSKREQRRQQNSVNSYVLRDDKFNAVVEELEKQNENSAQQNVNSAQQNVNSAQQNSVPK